MINVYRIESLDSKGMFHVKDVIASSEDEAAQKMRNIGLFPTKITVGTTHPDEKTLSPHADKFIQLIDILHIIYMFVGFALGFFAGTVF